MGVKPEPPILVGAFVRQKNSSKSSLILEIREVDGVRAGRVDNMEGFLPLSEFELCGLYRYKIPEPVMRLCRPTGGFGNPLPFYGDEFRPEVQLWCVRTLGYTPRMSHEDCWEKNNDGSWPEYDTAWFAYFDSEGDKIAFILAFCGAEVLDEFRREDGSI